MSDTPYNTFGRRVAARLIDVALLVVVVGAVAEVVKRNVDPLWAYAPAILAVFMVPAAYFVIVTHAWSITIGKGLLGLRVYALSTGRAPPVWRSVLRELPLMVMTVVGICLLGYRLFDCPGAKRHGAALTAMLGWSAIITAAWWFLGILVAAGSGRARTLHDLVGGSVVVLTEHVSNPLDPLAPEPSPSTYPAGLEPPHSAPELKSFQR